jgi:hypothetical protein
LNLLQPRSSERGGRLFIFENARKCSLTPSFP